MPEDPIVVEGSQEEPTEAEKAGGNVPLTKYVGVKAMLQKREETLTTAQAELEQTKTQLTGKETEVKNLGEQLEVAKKSAVDPERIKTLEGERDAANTELAQMKKGALLKEHNIKPEDVEGMSDEQIQAFIKGKGQERKPGADVGAGGGGAVVSGTARQQIRAGFDSLHPSEK